MLQRLEHNDSNFIVFFSKGKRVEKKRSDFAAEITTCLARLQALGDHKPIDKVAIIGRASYEWLLFDMACLKGGYQSIAIPEFLAPVQIAELLQELRVDIVVADHELKPRLADIHVPLWYYRCPEDAERNFDSITPKPGSGSREINVRKDYSIGFTSGTTGRVKTIPLNFSDKPAGQGRKPRGWKLVKWYVRYRLSFWSRKDNMMIFFMPFSHVQQRSFLFVALQNKMNILISDPVNALKHLIQEKPNIMIAVPLFYETLAKHIKTRLDALTGMKKQGFRLYQKLRVNTWSEYNPMKRLMERWLFRKITSIYGGRADYFVTGSAPIDRKALEVFYSMGVRIFEGYGQSEIDVIASNNRLHFRLGSVGKPAWPVKIAEDGEIMVKFDEQRHNRKLLKVSEDGFIHTGDLGYLDKDGFLFLKGRKDEVIVMDSGKKVFPSEIEALLRNGLDAEHAVLCSPDNRSLSAILRLKKPVSKAELEKQIRALNRQLAEHERITTYALADDAFTPENGLLTSTFKVKRGEVIARFGRQGQAVPAAITIEEDKIPA